MKVLLDCFGMDRKVGTRERAAKTSEHPGLQTGLTGIATPIGFESWMWKEVGRPGRCLCPRLC